MLEQSSARPMRAALIVGAVLGLSAMTGLVFALWAENGTPMLRALVESGLAWCF